MKYYLGIDVGSVSVKTVIIDEASKIITKTYQRSEGQPIPKLIDALNRLKDNFAINNIVATGTGKHLLKDILGIEIENEIVTNMIAGAHFYPDVKTIIEIGGQDSKLIFIGKDKNKNPIITDYSMNEVCAAGTGSFLDHQAERLGITIQQFSELALKSKKPAHIAGRCTVFAKTDMIHLQQEGHKREDIINGLCYSLARNFIANLGKNREISERILFQGAVAANKGVIRAFEDLLKKRLTIPEHYEVMCGLGAALSAKKSEHSYDLPQIIEKLNNYIKTEKATIGILPPLVETAEPRPPKIGDAIKQATQSFIGVDVGSISTNIVVIDDNKNIIYQRYYYTKGEPLKVIKEGFAELGRYKDKLKVKGVGITGSGRYLFGEFIGADVIKNDITAQARAALEIDKDVDTVIEIGGQDSKFIRIKNGAVTSFEMNKVCAAGTGSFLEEQAKRLDLDIEREFADHAFRSKNPLDLGAKCTVFMESDVIHYQQKGYSREDIIAGLSYAIAKNFLEKVVINRKIGDNIIFLGGVASNKAVVAAFKNLLKKDMKVPDIHKNSGGYGAALIVRESHIKKTRFNGFDLDKIPYVSSSFICPHCINHCTVKKITIKEKPFFYGGLCGRYDKKVERAKDIPNYFETRNEILLSYIKNTDANRLQIGIPRIFLFYDFFPQWATFFNELGINIVLSEETNRAMANTGVKKAVVDTCFPIKASYGHIQDLLDKGITKIFCPTFVEFEADDELYKTILCPYKSGLRQYFKASMDIDVISPVITYEAGSSNEEKAFLETGKEFGLGDEEIMSAYNKACSALGDFNKKIEKISEEIDYQRYDKIIAIIGRKYNIYDKLMSLNMPQKFINKGILPLPMDFLPLHKIRLSNKWQDLVWRDSQIAIRAAKIIQNHENIYPLFITSFGCGQDSFLEKHLEKVFGDKPFLNLEIDEHTQDAGIITRCEAFIDTIERAAKRREEEYMPLSYIPYKLPKDKTYYIPDNGEVYLAICIAFKTVGFKAEMLPRADAQSLYLGNRFSSGKECLPYILILGDMIKLINRSDFKPEESVFFISGLDHCRGHQYRVIFCNILRELGVPMEVIAARIFPEKDEVKDILGLRFLRIFWNNWIAIDYINKKYYEVRPIATDKERCKRIYNNFIGELKENKNIKNIVDISRKALKELDSLTIDKDQRRPVIALVGEPYVGFVEFANKDLVKKLEDLGCIVWLPPNVSDYLLYIEKRRAYLSRKRKSLFYPINLFRAKSQEMDEKRIARLFKDSLKNFPEPTTEESFRMTEKYITDKYDSWCIFSIAKTLDFINKGVDGIINVMPFHCISHNVVTSVLRTIKKEHGNIPTIDFTFTGQQDTHIENRLEAFVHQVKQFYTAKEVA